MTPIAALPTERPLPTAGAIGEWLVKHMVLSLAGTKVDNLRETTATSSRSGEPIELATADQQIALLLASIDDGFDSVELSVEQARSVSVLASRTLKPLPCPPLVERK